MLLAVVLIGALLLHPVCYVALFGFALAAMMEEYYRMASCRPNHAPARVLAIIMALAVFILGFCIRYYGLSPKYMPAVLMLLPVLFAAVLLEGRQGIEKLVVQDICFPLVYLLPPFMVSQLLVVGSTGNYTPLLFIAVILLVWASDIGAYAFGMIFGRRQSSRKLAPHISPNKTWIGVLGSFVFALAAASGVCGLHWFDIKLWQWLLAALLVCVFGIFGDLFESLIKRHFGKKDSGAIVIGHGGLLDRFDAALFAIPAVTVFFILTGII